MVPPSRVRRVHTSSPGLSRRRRGRGFSYVDERGEPIRDPRIVERIRKLAIPPAYIDVWICLFESGRIKIAYDAVGDPKAPSLGIESSGGSFGLNPFAFGVGQDRFLLEPGDAIEYAPQPVLGCGAPTATAARFPAAPPSPPPGWLRARSRRR